MIEVCNTSGSTGGSWGFDAVQVMQYPTVTFSCTDEDVVGKTPVSQKITTGSFTIPTNITLYKEGYTLTAWNDGSKNYAIGATYTPTADVTLTPVFTKNTQDIKYRNAEVTVKWDGNTYSAINYFTYQGNTGVYVAQATVNGEKIDVAMNVDATSGKFGNNANNWCQCNVGTKLSFWAAKDAVVTLKSYSTITSTTIGGEVPSYTGSAGNYISTYTATADGSVELVSGGDIGWFGYLQVVLPATTASKTLGTNGYSTFASEYPCTVTGATVYKAVKNDETGNYTLTVVTGTIPTGAGVILKGTEGETATATYSAKTEDAMTGNALKGVISSTTEFAAGTNYVLASNGTKTAFVQMADGKEVSSLVGKAYLNVPSGSAKAVIFFDDEATGINNVNAATANNAVRYNLAGQRVNATAKGIVIMNGKKYMNK